MQAHPPGPKPRPVVGNAARYARDPLRFIESLTRSYGDVSSFTLGSERAFVITNPADVERVLVSDSGSYEKPQSLRSGSIDGLLGDGLLLSEGDFWRRQRKRAQPAFAPGRVAGFADTIAGYADALVAGWRDGEVVEIDPAMARVTVEVIVAVMFGTSLDDATVARIQENLEPLGRQFQPDPIAFVLPEWVPTRERRAFDRAVTELDGVLDDLVAGRDGDGDGTDLVSILLAAKEDEAEVTEKVVRDELMTMLLAGHDTTALTLTYTWYLFAQHPEIEARVHEEVDTVFEGETPTMAGVRRLDYTERVLQEAMRLYPPVYALFREPTRPVSLGGYRIPEGSIVMLSQWGVHRDPRWYDDPETFDPDRWTRERARERPNYAYFPFGGGPRHCIGKHLSMLEAKLILARVAQDKRLRLAPDQPTDLTFTPSLTMHPETPIRMTVEARD